MDNEKKKDDLELVNKTTINGEAQPVQQPAPETDGEEPAKQEDKPKKESKVKKILGVVITALVVALIIIILLLLRFCSPACNPVESEHEWGEWTVSTPATCETYGERTRTCIHNGEHKETEVIPALGHDWNEWVIVTPATCDTAGEIKRTCSRDESHTETEVIPATGHRWSDTYAFDETNHWHECLVCGENKDVAAHKEVTDPAVAATCTQTGLTEGSHCSVCGKVIVAQIITTKIPHDYQETTRIAATCDTAGSVTYKCTVCGDEYTQTIAALGHAWSEWKTIIEPQYNVAGLEIRVCANDPSHEEEREIPALKHIWQDDWQVQTAPTCTENGVEIRFCHEEGCDEFETRTIPATGHDFGEWTVTTPATCDTAGEETRICANDESHTETKPIPATGHNYQVTNTVAATCDQDGYEVYTCSKCNETYIKTLVKLGHDYKQTAKQAATCDNDGYITYTCSRCGDEYTQTIKALGHNYKETTRTEATCEEDGSITYTCSRCQDSYTETIPAIGHVWGEWQTVTEPQYNVEGLEIRICANDPSHIDQRTIPALKHVWEDDWQVQTAPTCTEDGVEIRYCHEEGCTEFETRTISKTGHNFGEWTTTKEATCTEAGEEIRICANDESHTETRPIPATGHTSGEWIIDKEATCTEDGGKRQVCSVCGATIATEVIPATGHTFGDWTINNPTCTENGSAVRTCETDPTHKEEITIPATGHNYSKTYSYDKDNHWYECIICGDKKEVEAHTVVTDEAKEATCTETGLTEGKHCEICGAVLVEQEVIPAKGHTIVLDQAVAATCTTTGKTAGAHCSVCGVVLREQEEIEALGHDMQYVEEVKATCTTDGVEAHYYCTRCGQYFEDEDGATETTLENLTIKATGHDYGEWQITPATCETAGVKIRICANDPTHIETQEIKALGHDLQKVDKVEATCTQTGVEEHYICTRCGKYFDTEKQEVTYQSLIIPVKEHTLETIVATDATCTDKGLSAGTRCSVCGKVFTAQQEIPALGHDYETTAVTPVHDGYELTLTCQRCDDIVTVTIKATNHNFVHWTVKTLPTCTETGVYVSTCSDEDCEVQQEVEVPALGHNWQTVSAKTATCTESGWSEYQVCTRCGEKQGYTEIPATNHDWDEWVISKLATCNTAGVKTRTCKNDSTHIETEEIPALGHDFDELGLNEEVKATCISTGVKAHYYCSVCGKYFDEDKKEVDYKDLIIPVSIEHSLGDIVEKKEPTCKDTGLAAHYYCETCGMYFNEQKVEVEYDTLIIPTVNHASDGEAVIIVAATCTEKGYKAYVCKWCGAYFDGSEIEALGHEWDEGTETLPATCATDGIKTFTCEYDSTHIKTEIIEKTGEHTYEWTGDTSQHWQVCTVCNYVDETSKTGHSGNGIIVDYKVEPTCTTPGYGAERCTTCQLLHYYELPAINHDNGNAQHRPLVPQVEATCTTDGVKAHYECLYCDAVFLKQKDLEPVPYEDLIIPATGHTWGEWTIDKDNTTCTEMTLTRECSVCHKTETITQNVTAHKLSYVAEVPATCTTDGTAAYYECTVCHKLFDLDGTTETTLEQLTISATGHSESDWIIDSEATCTQAGSKHTECTVCGETIQTATIPVLEHTWTYVPVDYNNHKQICSVCGAEGETSVHNMSGEYSYNEITHWYECSDCGYQRSQTSHWFKYTSVPNEWSPTTSNQHIGICETCGYEKEAYHTYASSYTYISPTECKYEYKCSSCGYISSSYTGAHNLQNATDNGDGTHRGSCNNCHYYISNAPHNNTQTDSNGGTYFNCYTCKTYTLAYKLNADGQSYTVTGKGAISDSALIIPDTFMNKPVTAINTGAFGSNTNLTSLRLGANIETIGSNSFWGCNNLTDVIFNNKLKAIELGAFGSTGLSVVNIPSSVTYIGDLAFARTKIEEFIVPSTVTYLGGFVFNLSSLKKITFLDGDTEISIGNVCCQATKLETVIFSSRVHRIGSQAFENCTSLEYVYFPKSITEINVYLMFTDCSSTLKEVEFEALCGWYDHQNASIDSRTLADPANAAQFLIANGNGLYMTYLGGNHDYSDGWTVDDVAHWHVCTVCGAYSEKEEHDNDKVETILQATCTSYGVVQYSCSVCGKIIQTETVEKTEHTLKDTYDFDGDYHWIECSVCGEINNDKEEHIFGSYTDNSDGTHTATCSTCGYSTTAEHTIIVNIENKFGSGSIYSTFKGAYYDCDCGYQSLMYSYDSSKDGYAITGFGGLEEAEEVIIDDIMTFKGDFKYVITGLDYDVTEFVKTLKGLDGVPRLVVSIGEKAFQNCTNLVTVNIASSVQSIEGYAFQGCTNLKNITLPSKLTTINSFTFNNCISLTSIDLPDTLTTINQYAFYGCTGLTEITIPAKTYTIQDWSFTGCVNLNSVIFENPCGWRDAFNERYVENLNDPTFAATYLRTFGAYNQTHNLYRHYVGDTLSSCIGIVHTFEYIHGENKIVYVSYGDQHWRECSVCGAKDFDSVAFHTFAAPTANDWQWSDDYSMAYVTVECSVCHLSRTIFAQIKVEGNDETCIAAGYKTYTATVTFNGTEYSDTREKTIPATDIHTYGDWQYTREQHWKECSGCANVIELGEHTFDGNGTCTVCGLTQERSAQLPESVGLTFNLGADGSYYFVSGIGTLITATMIVVPAYYDDGTNGRLPVTKIGEWAFNNNSTCKKIVLPNTITYIEHDAFSTLTVLETINIPSSVTYIGDSAFKTCKQLTSIVIPASVTYIGQYAFSGCVALTTIIIEGNKESGTVIEQNAFDECSAVKSLKIGEGVTQIGNYAFSKLISLESVTIPSSVTTLGGNVFEGCTALTNVIMSKNVTSVGWGVFNQCNNFTINFDGTKSDWDSISGIGSIKGSTSSIKLICTDGEYTI